MIISCKKETAELKINSSKFTSLNVLKCSNYSELFQKINLVQRMTSAEFEIFQKNNHYTSFGKKCDEIYSSFNPKTASKEDFENFLKNNKKYINLITREDGDKYLETQLSNNPIRYLLNSNRMIIVGERVYKYFNEGLLSSDVSNFDNIINIEYEDAKCIINPNYCFVNYSDEFANKDLAHDCGTYSEDRNTVGNDRTFIQVGINFIEKIDDNHYLYAIYGQIRPYHQVLGIWYYCSRTLSGNFGFNLDYKQNNIWCRLPYSFAIPNQTSTNFAWSFQGTTNVQGDIHFGSINAWGRTPSTGYAEIYCNVGL